jgi:hypothetical protein
VVDGLEDGKTILVDKELVLTDELVVAAVDDGKGCGWACLTTGPEVGKDCGDAHVGCHGSEPGGF